MSDEASASDAAAQAPPYRHCANVRESQTTDRRSGETRHFLRIEGRELFVFSEQDYFIWKELDGSKSLEEVKSEFRARFGFGFGERELSNFINDLLRLGLIEKSSNDDMHAAEGHEEGSGDPSLMLEPASASGAAPLEPGAVRFPSRLGWRTRRREPFTRVLGDPDKLFRSLAAIFWPVRWLAWLLIPGTFLSCLIVLKHAPEYGKDWHAVVFNIWWWPTLWFAEHIQNGLTRVVEGMVICGYGGAVHQYRIRAFMGVLLRAFVDESSLKTMPLRSQLWAHASTLLFRLAVFSIGTWVWIESRQTYPITSKIAVFCSVLGAVTFLITACPLMPQEGYHLLATYVGQPDLMRRAWRFVGIRLKGRPAPDAMTGAERWGLVFMGIGIAVVGIVYLEIILLEIEVDAVKNMGGFGALLVIAVYVAAGLYFYSLRKFAQKMRAMQSGAMRRRAIGGGAIGGRAMRGGEYAGFSSGTRDRQRPPT